MKYHAHQCYEPHTSKVYISRDVVFIEDKFPFTDLFAHLRPTSTNITWVPMSIPAPLPTSNSTQSHSLPLDFTIPCPIPVPSITKSPLQPSSSSATPGSHTLTSTPATLNREATTSVLTDENLVVHMSSLDTQESPQSDPVGIVQPPPSRPVTRAQN